MFDILGNFVEVIQANPKSAPQLVRSLMFGLAVLGSALSFIPFTNNFGGALANVMIGSIFRPFEEKAVGDQVKDFLDNFFPTREMAPRMLVSGVEAGAIPEDILLEELVDSGTKDRAIRATLALARVKRFEAATKDDIFLLRQYERTLTDATIATLQDEVRATINDLRDRRREIARELRRGPAS